MDIANTIAFQPTNLRHVPDQQLQEVIQAIYTDLTAIRSDVLGRELANFKQKFSEVLSDANAIVEQELTPLIDNKDYSIEQIRKCRLNLLAAYSAKIDVFIEEDLPHLGQQLESLSQEFYHRFSEIVVKQPKVLVLELSAERLVSVPGDSKVERKAKRRKRTFKFTGTPKVSLPFQGMVKYHFEHAGLNLIKRFQHKLGESTYGFQSALRVAFIECLSMLEALAEDEDKVLVMFKQQLANLEALLESQHEYLAAFLQEGNIHLVNLIASDTSKVGAPDLARQMKAKPVDEAAQRQEVEGFAHYWLKNQRCASIQNGVDISLHRIGYALKALAKRLKEEIKTSVFGHAGQMIEAAQQRVETLNNCLANQHLQFDDLPTYDFSEGVAYNDLVVSEIMSEIKNLVEELPESLEALDELSRQNFGQQQGKEVNTFSIDLLHIADYLIDQQVQLPIEGALQTIPVNCMKNLAQLMQHMRLVSFSMDAQVPDTDKLATLQEVVAKSNEILSVAKSKVDQLESAAIEQLDHIFDAAIANLNATYIIHEARTLETASKASFKRTRRLRRWNDLQAYLSKLWTTLLAVFNDKRDELNQTDFERQNKLSQNLHAKMRAFVEALSPEVDVLDQLPVYYQQLFTGKHAPRADFLNHRDREQHQFEKALRRIQEGANGGILVLGDALAGKTLFSEVVARKHCSGKVHKIEPPATGSVRSKDFLRVLQKQLKSERSTLDMLEESAQPGDCFIFDDVELWWERSGVQNGALNTLLELIETYANQYTIIVNCNRSAFRLINRVEGFDRYFLETIQLSPFNARSMRETILERHKAGGLEFSIEGLSETTLPERKLKRLMDEYFRYSEGNIGVALHLWQANIVKANASTIEIKAPQPLELPLIDSELEILLAQFVLHKHLTLARIKRIFNLRDKVVAEQWVQNLMRSGLVEPIMGSSYRLSPFLLGRLTDHFQESKTL